MSDNIIKEDVVNLISFLKKTNRFTNGPEVKNFEKNGLNGLGLNIVYL